jgi:hypothetical protein
MAQKIGYQDGIEWLVNFLKKFPLVKYRPVGDRPAALEQWYGLEKLERMLRILKDDHDAGIVTPSPQPPPTPEPPPRPTPVPKLAPQAYNRGSRGQNARFNIRENCVQVGNEYADGGGFRYDDSGLCKGGRTEPFIAGLKPSDEMDGREPWDVYIGPDGQPHPPYPPESYLK